MNTPLKYHISDWHQLIDVQSNNSRDLYITVTDCVQDDRLVGLKLQIKHQQYGVLFCIVINSRGSLLSDITEYEAYSMSTKQILIELLRWGFDVEYVHSKHLPESQLDFIESLKSLNFDKIRLLNVYHYEKGQKLYKWYIVAFNVEHNSDWLLNTYSPSVSEYTTSLKNGYAVNLSDASLKNNWDWSWLDFVAGIDDILKENGR